MQKNSTSDQLDMRSPDLIQENIEKIAALFPNCVTESAEGKVIDFDLLKQELSPAVVEGNKERYRMEWPGKREAIVTANLPITKTLRPVREESMDFDNTENLYIEGDNLEVLKILQESYLGKIKMIYIDPPYNTGKDFVYKDNFTQNSEEYKEESGQKDEYSQRLIANPETAGRYHSDWLTMMYPRLKLARNLLKDDGVIFISIDDNEVHNLRKICDEIFGEANFVANVVWQKRTAPDMRTTFSDAHEDILIFVKSESNFKGFNKLNLNEGQKERYKNPDNDPRGPWVASDFTAKGTRPNQKYGITSPSGKVHYPPEGKCWQNVEEGFLKQFNEGRFYFGVDGNSFPRRKNYLSENDGRIPWTWWANNEVGHSQEGKLEVNSIFGKAEIFSTPKPIRLLKRILETSIDSNSVILDFFSGSSSLAHAIIELNAETNGATKYIQVQLAEATDEKSEAYMAGYKNICEIGKERIRRAGKQTVNKQKTTLEDKKAELEKIVNGQLTMVNDPKVETLKEEIENLQLSIEKLDIGFRVYRLADSNMQDVYYKPQEYKQESLELFADNVKPDRTADDLLAQIILDWGLPLSLKIEQITIAGKQVFKVAQNSLYACFDKGIDEEFAKAIAKDAPLRIVFRDRGFKDDTAKINVKQLLKQLCPETEMKVI